MRTVRRAILIFLLCAAAYLILLPRPAGASDSGKPLTQYTHTVWTRKAASRPRSSTRSRRLGMVICGWPRPTVLSDSTVSASSTGVPRPATPHFWALCEVCVRHVMGVSGLGPPPAWSDTFAGTTSRPFLLVRSQKPCSKIATVFCGSPRRMACCDFAQRRRNRLARAAAGPGARGERDHVDPRLRTSLAGSAAAVSTAGSALYGMHHVNLTESDVHAWFFLFVLVLVLSSSLALTGPGGYSLDARLSGWRRIRLSPGKTNRPNEWDCLS